MADCRWADPANRSRPPGRPLGPQVRLASGLMEIAYDYRGESHPPRPLHLRSRFPRGGFLSLGKLTARVEKSQKVTRVRKPKSESDSPLSPLPSPLFSVRTPTAVVTDLGTEFGVEVDEEGRTDRTSFSAKSS